jgi:hypothetical protein
VSTLAVLFGGRCAERRIYPPGETELHPLRKLRILYTPHDENGSPERALPAGDGLLFVVESQVAAVCGDQQCGVAAIIVSLATKVDRRWAPGAVGVWMNKSNCFRSNEMTFITTLPTKESPPLLTTERDDEKWPNRLCSEMVATVGVLIADAGRRLAFGTR